MQKPVYVLDTTVLIDLYEAGHVDDVLCVAEARFAVTTNVLIELKHYDDATGERIDITPTEKMRLRTKLGVECLLFHDGSDEFSDFVELQKRLGPGESEAAAIAVSRGHTLVSDDKSAQKRIRSHFKTRRPNIGIINLNELIRLFGQKKWLSKTICDDVVSFIDGKEKSRKGG